MTGGSATVVVNNHNYGRYLREAIDSALAQTHRNLQVIVVDDGSTDDSRRTIEAYGGDVLAIAKTNGGQASAYNAAMPHVAGDVVVFLDADDTLAPVAVAVAVDRMSPTCVKATWRMSEIDAAGRRTGTTPTGLLPEGNLRDLVLDVGPDSYLSAPGSGNAWARSFLNEVCPVPEHPYRRGADGFLITIAPLYGEVAAVDDVLGCYRVHGGNGFWAPTLLERTTGSLERYRHRHRSLELHRRRLGFDAAPDQWEERNPYVRWLLDVLDALRAIERIVEPGGSFVIVDDDQLGTALVQGRRGMSLLEEGGSPSDDRHAIDALERRAAQGVQTIAIAWTASWWLSSYPEFAAHLRRRAVVREDRGSITVFELRSDA